jgi:hypothetical protein
VIGLVGSKARRRSQLVASRTKSEAACKSTHDVKRRGSGPSWFAWSPAAARAGEQRRGTMPAALIAGATDPGLPLGQRASDVHNTQHSGALFLLVSSNSSLYRTPFPHRLSTAETCSGRRHQISLIRFSSVRSPACPPAAHRRPFLDTTGYFRRKPLPPSQRGLHRFHKSWSRSTASRRRLYPRP